MRRFVGATQLIRRLLGNRFSWGRPFEVIIISEKVGGRVSTYRFLREYDVQPNASGETVAKKPSDELGGANESPHFSSLSRWNS
jgi:hypothetical protein